VTIKHNNGLSIKVVIIGYGLIICLIVFTLVTYFFFESSNSIIDNNQLTKQIVNHFFSKYSIYLLLLLVAILATAIALSSWIIKPLLLLENSVKDMGYKEENEQLINIKETVPKEIGQLSYSLNNILKRFYSSINRQNKYKAQIDYIAKNSPLMFSICNENGSITYATGKLLTALGHNTTIINRINIKDIYSLSDNENILDLIKVKGNLSKQIKIKNIVIDLWSSGIIQDEITKEKYFMLLAIDVSDTHIMAINKQLLKDNQALNQNLLHVTELERKKIAAELHDQIGQDITSIKAMISIIKNNENKNIKPYLENIDGLSITIQKALRNMLRSLWPEALDNVGLEGAVRDLVDNFKLINPATRVSQHYFINEKKLDKKHSIQIYRIISEALTNINKHAYANTVRIQLDENKDNALTLIIEDNGIGYALDSLTVDKYGIKSIKERIRALNGEISIETKINEGTKLQISIPL